MAKSKYSLSEAQIAKRIKEGRGSGSGTDYSPWVRVDEVPSLGRSRQVYSHLTKRIHHLLSDLEFAVFLLLDNNPSVTDIREQFPLIRDDTRDIARENNLLHPANNGVDTVMSSDFMVDSTDKSEPKFVLQAKYTDNLGDARTIEKLEIERRYWKQKELPWYLVTEREIDPVAKANIDWLYVVKGELESGDKVLTASSLSMFKAAVADNPGLNIIELCKVIDRAYDLELGESLYDLRVLCASRIITFDVRKPFRKLSGKDFTCHELESLGGAVNVAS